MEKADKSKLIKRLIRIYKYFDKEITKSHKHTEDEFDSIGQLVPVEVLDFEKKIIENFGAFLYLFYNKTIDKQTPDSQEDIRHRCIKIHDLCIDTVDKLNTLINTHYKNKDKLKNQIKKLYENFFIYLKWNSELKVKDHNKSSFSSEDIVTLTDINSFFGSIRSISLKGIKKMKSMKNLKRRRSTKY